MEKKLKVHERNSFAFAAQRTEFPDDPILKFENIPKQVEVPFTVYADFESILKQLSGDGNKCQEHITSSYPYQIVSSIPGIEFGPRLYVAVDAANHFLDALQEDLNRYIMALIEKDVDMMWDDEAKKKFESAAHCHVRKQTVGGDKVRYHFISLDNLLELHITIATRYKLPIVFHNLRVYDAHLIFQKVKREHGKINVIPNNSERYISFDVGRLKFLDYMQLLSCGLNKHAEHLSDDVYMKLLSELELFAKQHDVKIDEVLAERMWLVVRNWQNLLPT